jgi:hypothetical protein
MAVVALSARHKRMLGSGLRELVLRFCVGAGVLLGVLWALHHQYVPPKHPCPALHAARGLAAVRAGGRCISSDLAAAVGAWLIPIGVGAIVGTFVGFMLALTIRLGRKPRVG